MSSALYSTTCTVHDVLHRTDVLNNAPLRLDAEILLAQSMGCMRPALYAHSQRLVPEKAIQQWERLWARRQAGEPLSYLTGEKEFWSLSLCVSAHVLVPRPESELLVSCALEQLNNVPCNVVDLGTGSGALAISMASERPQWRITGIDCDRHALSIAEHNGHKHHLTNICWVHAHWCESITLASATMIVSNPPYISVNDPCLHEDGVCYEPRLALCSGIDGLDSIRHIVCAAYPCLQPHGYLLIEHAPHQRKAVRQLMRHYRKITTFSDLAGRVRVTMAQK